MINGVTFGTLHSYEHLGLILTAKTIGMPEPKTATVEIPGVDGELDYTEYFGEIRYKTRRLSFEFSIITEPEDFLTLYSRLQKMLNGRRMQITLDDDPDYYYTGRISVNDWKSNGRIGKVVIDVNADPYKLKKTMTVISRAITVQTAINCTNTRKQVIPKITVSANVNVSFGNYTKSIAAGQSIIDEEILFKEGQNVLIVTPTNGAVTVTIEYQEGDL